MERGREPNRLVQEKSPYLLQHAYNPVNWYPWGTEAFEKARTEQKPIFLSIGYSTCHWCHVMERESFETDSIAAILNQYFVSIKVDREERPDVDKVYMASLQAMGQNGGWPMSIFLTPDLKPFYGGTYYPPEPRHGRIGFPQLLMRVNEIWQNERGKVLESADGLTEFLKGISAASAEDSDISDTVLDLCFQQFGRSYEPQFGGFGGAPKFPRPVVFDFLLRYYHRTEHREALEMCEHTLRTMSEGGVYDHIGGGFHRYSVDGEWRVPHFEKMLYDQAQLVNAYVDLYQITGGPHYATIIREVLDYVQREMSAPSGGFYSAEDADSPKPESPDEEGEGAFYLWTKKEILNALGKEKGEIFSYRYGVEEVGNALIDPQHEFTGKNILYVAHSIAETAGMFSKSPSDIASYLKESRKILFDVRSKRVRPPLDDKILTSWNGLMIGACARASWALNEPFYLEAARKSAEFVLSRLYDSTSRVLNRRYRDGQAKFDAHLDDYAFFVSGLLDLYEVSFDVRWLELAAEISHSMIDLFWDDTNGGFFDTSGKDTSILTRMKEHYDGAEPAGNSIATMNLLRLSHMTDNAEWRKKSEKTLKLFAGLIRKQPMVMPKMVATFDFSIAGVKQIFIAGEKEERGTDNFLQELRTRYLPNKVVMLVDGKESTLSNIVPFVSQLKRLQGEPTAYICEDFLCRLPTTEVDTFVKLIESTTASQVS